MLFIMSLTRTVPQRRGLIGIDVRDVSALNLRDGKPFSGQSDGRLEEDGPRQLPIEPVHQLVTPDLTWDPDPLRTWMDVNIGRQV